MVCREWDLAIGLLQSAAAAAAVEQGRRGRSDSPCIGLNIQLLTVGAAEPPPVLVLIVVMDRPDLRGRGGGTGRAVRRVGVAARRAVKVLGHVDFQGEAIGFQCNLDDLYLMLLDS